MRTCWRTRPSTSTGLTNLSGPEQINVERDNIRVALATAIDTDNASLAVQLVANHPHHHGYGGMGEVFEIPASVVIDLNDARAEPGYPRVLIAAAWHAYLRGDYARSDELRRQALAADRPLPNTERRPRIELDECNLTAMVSLAAGDYAGALTAYRRGAELATADGYPGLAAINLAVCVNTALLGGGGYQGCDRNRRGSAQARPTVRNACRDRHQSQLPRAGYRRRRPRTRQNPPRGKHRAQRIPMGGEPIRSPNRVLGGRPTSGLGPHSRIGSTVDAPGALDNGPTPGGTLPQHVRARTC